MDHWVDVVRTGYPPSAFRVAGDDIHAGPTVWEMVLAIRWAAELTGISDDERAGIFCENGTALLRSVRKGKGERQ
jgi:hypothetical protein